MTGVRRRLAIRPTDVVATMRVHRFGSRDPTTRLLDGRIVRATRTPDGPGTIEVRQVDLEAVEAMAWGPGAAWLLDSLPGLVGHLDDDSTFEARHEVVARAARNHRWLRLSRSGSVLHALGPAVLGQRVTAGEAIRQWRQLCQRFGGPAPGPYDLVLPPDPTRIAATPSWWYHRVGLERRRAETLARACRHERALEAGATLDPAGLDARLDAIPGLGPWTRAETLGPALGDPDAVAVGDYHLCHAVVRAFTGALRGSDEEMLQHLEPYRGQRGRVVRLLLADGWTAPRLGPRRPVPPIASW